MKDLAGAGRAYKRLGYAKKTPKLSGEIPAEYQNLLSGMQASADPTNEAYAGRRSDEMKDILGKLSGGLQGLSSEENTALREQAQREISRGYETSLRDMMVAGSRSGLRGASATAQAGNLARQKGEDISNMEQDLLVKNIDIQDSRRNDYLSALTGIEGDEKDRASSAAERALGATRDRYEEGQAIDKYNLENLMKDRLANITGAAGLLGAKTARVGGRKQERSARRGRRQGARDTAALTDALSQLFADRFGTEGTTV